MPNAEDDLRATSDAIQDDAHRLKALEKEKAALAADDPRVAELSREIERLGRALADKTSVERAIAEELQRG